MSHLLDVSVLVACGWKSHVDHHAARRWLERQRRYYTCPIAQLGFLRVSLSPAFRASFDDARDVLAELTALKGARFLADRVAATMLPALQGANEVTDAYLVGLARASKLRLATLDDALCQKPWAREFAVNPIRRPGRRVLGSRTPPGSPGRGG